MREREAVLNEFDAVCETVAERAMADEIVRLREVLAAACVQGTPMGEAHTTRVTVLDEWRVVDKYESNRRTAYDEDQAENMRAYLDRVESVVAPHRVVRVALVDANHPETPERSTRVTDEMVERAAKATVARVVAEAFELYADEEEAMRVHREYARIALTAALEGPRDQ